MAKYKNYFINIKNDKIDNIYELINKNNKIIKSITINIHLPYVAIYFPYSKDENNNYFLQGDEASSFIEDIDKLWNNNDISYGTAVISVAEDYM